MPKITLILGGARSGKSSYALKLAEELHKSVTFIATAQAFDEEMSARIQKHKAERPTDWETLELPLNIASNIPQIKSELIILDCVTLWVTNLLMKFVKYDLVDEAPFMQSAKGETEALLAAIQNTDQEWLIVSNEIGLGLVPPYQMGRVYRDALGWVNQRLAQEADKVLFMVAGIPMTVKGS
ncbi:MAG: bifunctional adenosylcobinamide kinase/adenosylcobinamide-phosphate guanylyltransferase [Anaerolineales bacterium]|nr:bifunctional adenosylcobinamide kinase/adenosylcobinamide-phosphate guanylyltransferase [Anaerolineales bacterium]